MTLKLPNYEPTAILNQSKSPIYLETRDLIFAKVLFCRHFEYCEDTGDEVGRSSSENGLGLRKCCDCEFNLLTGDSKESH